MWFVESRYEKLVASLSRSYIKGFAWCNFYDSQSVFRFWLCLHFDTSRSYSIRKSCSYRVFSFHEFKQNDSRTRCNSSNYYTNFSEKQAKEKETKKKSRYETVA